MNIIFKEDIELESLFNFLMFGVSCLVFWIIRSFTQILGTGFDIISHAGNTWRLIISEFQRLPFLKPLEKIPVLSFPGAWICCPLLQAHGYWILFLNLPVFRYVTFGLVVLYFSIHILEVRVTGGIRRLHKIQFVGNVLTVLLTCLGPTDYWKHSIVLHIIV